MILIYFLYLLLFCIFWLSALAALQLFGKNFRCSGQNNSWQKSSADIWTSGRAGKIAGRPYCSFKFAVISIYFYALVATFFTPPFPGSAHSSHHPSGLSGPQICHLTIEFLSPDRCDFRLQLAICLICLIYLFGHPAWRPFCFNGLINLSNYAT